jgi:hypothetical protein
MKPSNRRPPLLSLCPLSLRILSVLCVLLMPALSSYTLAAVINVPANHATIQQAINASSDGDEIIVSPGTYVENISFNGKNIVLRSTDPTNPGVVASTIIDGNQAGSVVAFSGAELETCVLSGFTITNGNAPYGGGIYGNYALAAIRNNTIDGNTANYGGGLHHCYGPVESDTISGNLASYVGGGLYECGGTIEHNTIFGNSAVTGGGLFHCAGTIENNIISDNVAYEGGGLCQCVGTIQNNMISSNGAMFGGGLNSCGGAIQNNTISYNSAQEAGGLLGCNGIIQNNTIYGNSAVAIGGGLYYCDGTIRNNTISGNSANDWAGGFFDCDAIIQNNIISGNSADLGGGLYWCDSTIQNNTIWGNSASSYGGGLYDCNATIENCIVWQNSALTVDSAQLDYCSLPSYSCIQDWTGGGTGNIEADPQLVGPANGDFHLQATSPCIDAGCLIAGLTQDFEGDPRPYDGTSEPRGDGSDYDIGADEFVRVATYYFTANEQGWTSHTVPLVFGEPEFAVIPGFLQISSTNNTNNFGYWQSPENAVPTTPNFLYRAQFRVSSDQSNQSVVPQIRLRVNSLNLQQADYLGIESSGDGGASPSPTGITYDLHFVPPSSDTNCMLAFDLLNFNPEDAAQATLSLDQVLVERFPLEWMAAPTLVRAYEFTTSTDGWTTGGAPIVFTNPEFICEGGALTLRSTTNTNTFGYWSSNPSDIMITPNSLYRATFEVRTDVTQPTAVPQMRLRFNTGNFQASRTQEIMSIGDGANSPGTTDTVYDKLYFWPPENCVGENLIVSFDMGNFDPGDAPTGALTLERVMIESFY